MDPVSALGVGASVITVVGMTASCLKLCSKIIGLSPSQHTSDDLKSISDMLYKFNGSIKNLQTHLELCEEDQARLSALEELKTPVKDCEVALKVLQDHLKGPRLGRYLVGAGFDSKIKRSLNALDHSRALFVKTLRADRQTIVSAVERYVRNNGEDLRELKKLVQHSSRGVLDLKEQSQRNHDDEVWLYKKIHRTQGEILSHGKNWIDKENERRQKGEADELIRWLSSLDFEKKQNDILSQRYPNTGGWMLGESSFKDWVAGSPRPLWCPGMPGAGKTVVAAVVVDHLRRTLNTSETPVASIYCNYKQQESQSALAIMESILQQLVLVRPTIPEMVRDFHHQHKLKGTRPSLKDVSAMLSSQIRTFKKFFVVVDALDELSVNNPTRESLLDELRALQPYVHLFITSRPTVGALKVFEDALVIEIRATELDVSTYCAARLREECRLATWVRTDPNLQEEITRTLVSNAQGMFLLAKLHIDTLAKEHNKKSMRKILRNLPKDLPRIYEDAIQRVQEQDSSSVRLACRVLSWLSYAFKPLTVRELQHALAVELGDTTFDNEAITDPEDLVSVCAGLVTIDDESQIIRLIHYTTQEYFEQVRDELFPGARVDIAGACLTYLTLDDVGEQCDTINPVLWWTEDYERCEDGLHERYPFLSYAMNYWGPHVRGDGEKVFEGLIQRFLEDRRWWMREILTHKQWHLGSSFYTSSCLEGTLCCDLWLKSYPRVKGNHEDTLLFLLQAGADAQAGKSAISLALKRGNLPMARLLIEYGGDVKIKNDDEGLPALHPACQQGNEAVLRFMLDYGADIDAFEDFYGSTPLKYAVSSDYPDIVSMLLERGADVNFDNRVCGPVLLDGCLYGNTSMIKLLLAAPGCDPNIESHLGRTPLHAAIMGDYGAIAQLLIAHGANTEIADDQGETPLFTAADLCSEAIMQVMVEHGVDVNRRSFEGRTVLSQCRERRKTLESPDNTVDWVPDISFRIFSSMQQRISTKSFDRIIQYLVDHGATE